MNSARAVITGGYGLDNLGDDALMLANVQLLRKAYSLDELALYCTDAPYISKLVPNIKIIPVGSVKKLQAELLVYGGGTQFYSFPLTRRGSTIKRLARAIASPRRIINYFAKKIAPVKFVFEKRAAVGVGMGPFEPHSWEEEYTRNLFRNMDFVGVRDRVAYELSKTWQINNVCLGSDLCFVRELWNNTAHDNVSRKDMSNNIAIIARDWPHSKTGAAYYEPLLEAAAKLRADGYSVTFILFSKRTDQGWVQILRTADIPFIMWDPMRFSVQSFIEKLGDYDFVISARYHGAVFAAIMGTPVICIEVEQKLKLMAKTLDGMEYLWKQPFNIDELFSTINNLRDNYNQVVERMNSAVQKQRALAETMARDFIEFVHSI